MPGIGEALAEKITELLTTGRLPYYDTLKAEFPPTILELLQVPDLGPKKVQALWKSLAIGGLATLEQACLDGRVAALKGFGAKTQGEDPRWPRAAQEARGRQAPPPGRGRPHRRRDPRSSAPHPGRGAGEPRRERATLRGDGRRSGPDRVVGQPRSVFEVLKAHPDVVQVIADGESKCSVRLGLADLQVDLRVLPDEDFATALHHFTGSKSHHVRLRGMALDRGLKISEWGVHRGEEKLPVPDEAQLYRLLGLQWVPPELREDWGEVRGVTGRSAAGGSTL